MRPSHSFRAVRWARTVNLVLQALLVLTLVGGLNYLALRHAWRYDLTQHRRFSLSPETRSYLEALDQPVRIIVTLTADSENPLVVQAHRDVSGLLREYEYVTAGNPRGRVHAEFIDVYRRRREAEALGIDQPNIILLLCGDRRRVVDFEELYRIEHGEKTGFLGEKAFTTAILDVASPDKKKIYALSGHGEMRLDDVDPARGLSLLLDELRVRNLQVETLDLSASRQIPDDASMILIPGPQGRFEPFEEELLRQYLSTRAGRLLALLPPAYPNGLDNLLYDWGAQADDALIADQGAQGRDETGDLILYPTNSEHPVVSYLASNRIAVRFGPCRPFRPDPGRTVDSNLVVTPLLATADSGWGERHYRSTAAAVYDASADLPGPLAVATASERVTARDNLPFSVRGGRLIGFGGADWIANGRIASGGNLSLFLSSVNWLVDRDTQLSVPPRPIERFQLSLSQEELTRLRYSLLLLVPGIAALFGLIVYWTRRN